MESATYVALSRQTVLNRSVEVLANNIANATTTGFKASHPLFETYLASTGGGKSVAYVQSGGLRRDIAEGDITQTGNSLDTAISGDGYLTVGTADGTRYTRNGRFQLNAQRQLVNAAGNNVLDGGGAPITVPAGTANIAIGPDGSITADGNPVAKLGLVSFNAPQDMTSEGGGLLNTTETPSPDTTSQIYQGKLENSNVQPIIAMTQLLDLQRSFTSAQDVLDSEDTRQKNAIDKLAKTA